MELKVKEFATQQGVSDSIIYRHIRKHREQLGDSVVKKSKATWLTDEAQDYLRNLMVQQPIVVNEGAAPFLNQIEQLQNRIQLLEERIERKDVLIEQMQQREAEKDKLLQAAGEQKMLLDTVQREKEELQRKVGELEADYKQAAVTVEEIRSESYMRLQQAEEAEERELQALKRAETAEAELQEYEEKIQKLPKWKKWMMDV